MRAQLQASSFHSQKHMLLQCANEIRSNDRVSKELLLCWSHGQEDTLGTFLWECASKETLP